MERSINARKEQSPYFSFLLCLWRVEVGDAGDFPKRKIWRVSLESSLIGERQGFASLDDLFVLLLRQTGFETMHNIQGKGGNDQ